MPPCPRAYPQVRARPKQGPLAPAAFTTFLATMGPSDSLSTRRDFAFGLYPPPLPNVGRRGGSPQFRIRLYLRAVFHTPEASCAPPVLGRSLLPSPRHDGLGHFPFRVLLSRGCKVHALAFGPHLCSPPQRPDGPLRAFDAPLSPMDLATEPKPATRRPGRLTAAGLTPASLVQHLRSRSGASFRTRHWYIVGPRLLCASAPAGGSMVATFLLMVSVLAAPRPRARDLGKYKTLVGAK